MLDKGLYLLHEFLDAAERAAPDCTLGDQPKPPFHLIKPRGISGREVNLISRPLCQPGTHLRVFVSCIVIDNQVNIQFRRELNLGLRIV